MCIRDSTYTARDQAAALERQKQKLSDSNKLIIDNCCQESTCFIYRLIIFMVKNLMFLTVTCRNLNVRGLFNRFLVLGIVKAVDTSTNYYCLVDY